jgi:Flp pilus assembly protein TadG
MRRLNLRDDKGLATIAVVLAMPALLMMSALVFDGARGLIAARETQNAADAGALAKATDCAKGSTGTSVSGYAANGTALVSASCNTATGTATATMSKDIVLAFAAGGGTRTVTRTATARWGGLISTQTSVPVAVAACEFSQAILDGTTNITLYLDDPNPHTGCSSPSGGFGRLSGTGANECSVTPTYDASSGTYLLDGKSGNDLQKIQPCFDTILSSANPIVLVPLYDDAACGGRCQGNMQYPVKGYAMFKLTGYLLKGTKNPASVTCTNDCLVGDFIRFLLPGSLPTGTVTGGPDFGADTVFLAS